MSGPGQSTWEGGLFFKPNTLGNQIGNVPIDLSKSSLVELTAIGNITLQNPVGLPGAPIGCLFAIAITQDQNGNRAVTFGSAYLSTGSGLFSTNPGATDTVLCQLLSNGKVNVLGVFNDDAVQTAFGTVTTADNGTSQTLTAAMVTGGSVVYHTSAGGTTPTLTMPLATAIIAAIPGFQVGQSYVLRIINTNSGTATVATNTGITTTGTLTLATNTTRDFLITMTGAATLSMVSVGTGTTS